MNSKEIDQLLDRLIPTTNEQQNFIQQIINASQRDQYAQMGVKIEENKQKTTDQLKSSMARLHLKQQHQNNKGQIDIQRKETKQQRPNEKEQYSKSEKDGRQNKAKTMDKLTQMVIGMRK